MYILFLAPLVYTEIYNNIIRKSLISRHVSYAHTVSSNTSQSGTKCSHHFLTRSTEWVKVPKQYMQHALGYFHFPGKEQNIATKKNPYILMRFLI